MSNVVRYRSTWLVAAAFALVVAGAWHAYHPGLSGGFLFDDFVNMPVLGYYGRIDNWTAFWLYITSGSADPTGRPLAMLSFLIDANDWPADAYSFKRTSVLLHMLNGCLLTWLLLKLGRAGRHAETASAAAVLGAALWLLHPLLVSTTLYIVQRETILAGTFVLLGLLGYARGRELAEHGSILGVWLAAVSVGSCTVLAVLCKANGILLPLLALVVEILVLGPARPLEHLPIRRGFAKMRWAVLVLPSVLLSAYLLWKGYSGFVDGMPALRSWTLGERLLTEARVMLQYLGLLWLPRAFSPGLFNDSVAASTGLFSPPTTLLCLLAILGLATGAWRIRKDRPTLALAILFFLAGHLLESTVLPLELYFEHRNYLPAIFMFWPLALWVCEPAAKANRTTESPYAMSARHALFILLPVALGVLTHLAADLWGNERDQALLWAVRNPHSPRAQVTAAQIERTRGENAAATARLERAFRENPHEIQVVLNLLGAKCEGGGLTETDIERAIDALRMTPNPGRVGGDWFIHSLEVAQRGSCPGLTFDVLDRLLAASAENSRTPKTPGRDRQDRLSLQGRIALLRGQDEQALALFNAALDADLRPDAALDQTGILATAGKPLLALRHLDYFEKQSSSPPASHGWTMPALHEWLLRVTGYWDNEIAHMRTTLNQDIADQKTGVASP